MLLASPAVADGKPSPDVRIPAPKSVQPKLERLKTRSVHPYTGTVRATGPRFDVDGDGYSDLLLRGMGGSTQVWRSSTGEFTPYTINSGDSEEMQKDIITPGNLDGTGGPEVLTLSESGTLSLLHSETVEGTGSVAWSGRGWQIYNKVFAPGDVTGDGKPDLLARTYSGDLYLYEGTGSASSPFRARVLVGGGWQTFDQLVGVGDMNRDGIGDVVARTPGGDLYFYAGRGSATTPLAPRVKIGGGWNAYNQIVAADDWNGDGLADLLGRTASGDLYFYQANGSGGFNARQKVGTAWNGVDLFANSGANPRFGKTSMLGMDTAGTLFWYGVENNGLLTARTQVSDPGGFAGSRLAYASSLNTDGFADLLELYNGALYNGDSASSSPMATNWGRYNLFLGPGDLNDDGKGDLLARDGSGYLYLFRGNGSGTSLASPIRIGSGWNAYDRIVGAGDITGDGRADIVARTPSGTLYLYRGTGTSTAPFAPRVSLGTGWQQYNKLASPGDIDGDNRADLVAVNSSGELYRYSADGQGKFKARVKIGTNWNIYRNLY
ncbi:VCBS repeat-containing protein [Streptomyces sp. Li-HN-5-11]|nr:VCBS repeat-containing protein [Streptomyces sp. Li-HN-5-11]WNM35362.1 VCBS repeat-containing protein [Streptomyces sp. Li-HN-5-11]